MERKVKTRIFVISDTHSALPDTERFPKYAFFNPFPEADVAIHCGDLTHTGKLSEHHRALALLKSLPARLKIVIPGNHDLTLDEEYCRSHKDDDFKGHLNSRDDVDEVHDLYTKDSTTQAGIVYLTEGIRTFHLENGAILTIYASAYTPAFCDWAFAYDRSKDRFNENGTNTSDKLVPDYDQQGSSVSVMITHGPPMGILDTTDRGEHVGCEHLKRAVERYRPQLHCFGHIHEAWGAIRQRWSDNLAHDSQLQVSEIREEGLGYVASVDGTDLSCGEETVFVNASIMDLHYEPSQKPWIVDLMLPSAVESKGQA